MNYAKGQATQKKVPLPTKTPGWNGLVRYLFNFCYVFSAHFVSPFSWKHTLTHYLIFGCTIGRLI